MISHPAHFHMFRNSIAQLQNDGHKVVVVIRPKDVLEQLCIDAQMPYYKVKNRPKKWGMFGLAIFLVEKIFEVVHIVRKEHPDLLVGSDGVLAYAGTICNVPSFEFFEDDVNIIRLYAKMFFPFYTNIVCPNVCQAGKWDKKKIGYEGYQKLTYLHPNYFNPDKKIVKKYIDIDKEPYFILRFAQLTAHHDRGIHGFTKEVANTVINLLKPYGSIYITAEGTLDSEFEKYRLRIDPLDIHHILAYATLYIGDSQSMAVESSILGTPCVRFNDFVGTKKISVLEELEHKYGLTYGISSQQPELLYTKINELLTKAKNDVLRDEYQRQRQKMLRDKIDVTKFWIWFIENYPSSVAQAKNADEAFWKQFK